MSIRYYINPHPRYSLTIQTATAKGGAIYVEDRTGKVFDRLLRSLRRGDVVGVYRPFLLAPIKGRPKTRRTKWLARYGAIKAKGGKVVWIAQPDINSTHLAMVAYEEIASSGRGAAGREKSGRPPIAYTPEQLIIMEREWHSKKHKTRAGALKAIQSYGIKVKRGYLYSKFPVRRGKTAKQVEMMAWRTGVPYRVGDVVKVTRGRLKGMYVCKDPEEL